MDIKQEIAQLRDELERASYEYYMLDAPTMSDYEFDHKLRRLEELEANVKLQWFYQKDKVTEKLLELDDEFHHLLFKGAGKMQAYEMMKGMMVHFDRVRNMALGTLKDKSLVDDHAKILEAVAKRDADGARKLMDKHLKRYRVDEEEVRRRYPGYFKP